MSKLAKKVPDVMLTDIRFCPGCGEAIFTRILGEVLTEMDIVGDTVMYADIGCNFQFQYCLAVDTICPPHGRAAAGLFSQKKVRPEKYAISVSGDGGAYSIGLAETMTAATKNINATMFVLNNTFFAMTGGQMAPTTQMGQKTTTTPNGRSQKIHGQDFDVFDVMRNLDIAFLARTGLAGPGDIEKTKVAMKKAIEKQRDGKGFSLVEILSPCPTNWRLSPVNAMKRVKDELMQKYEMGIIIDK